MENSGHRHPQSFLKTISFFRSCCPRWRKSWPRFPSSAQTSENRTGLRLSLMVEMSRYRSTKSRCRNLTSSGLYCTFCWPMLYRVYSVERYLFMADWSALCESAKKLEKNCSWGDFGLRMYTIDLTICFDDETWQVSDQWSIKRSPEIGSPPMFSIIYKSICRVST